MTLTKEQQEETLQHVMEYFTKKEVERMDEIFFDFDDMRCTSKSVLDFLAKVKEKYEEDHNILIAAILYGIKLGELGYSYPKQDFSEKKLPEYGHAC
jgi:hypothetical protein